MKFLIRRERQESVILRFCELGDGFRREPLLNIIGGRTKVSFLLREPKSSGFLCPIGRDPVGLLEARGDLPHLLHGKRNATVPDPPRQLRRLLRRHDFFGDRRFRRRPRRRTGWEGLHRRGGRRLPPLRCSTRGDEIHRSRL